jgi:hypothetical protein
MDRNKTYEIFPARGVAEIKFGMPAVDVEQLWGAPDGKSKNFLGDATEVRDACLITYDNGDKGVAEIGFPSSYSSVQINEIKIFQRPHNRTIEDLKNLDSEAYEGQGFIVFKNLGISLSGFRGDDFEALTVTIFKEKWWDDVLRGMKRLS